MVVSDWLEIERGKYAFSVPEGDYRVHVRRYGDRWLIIEEGAKAVHSMMCEIRESRTLIDAVVRFIRHYQNGARDPWRFDELVAALRAYDTEVPR